MSGTPASTTPTVDIMIPVLNEAHVLERSIGTLRAWCQANLAYRWRIVVVDNGSTDGTRDIARRLTERWAEIGLVTLDERGRGRALRTAWTQSAADACCYMDVDLSTELEALPKILDLVLAGGCGVATGSRLHKGRSQVTRSLKRYVLSKTYNIMVRQILRTRVRDHQCGFKAVNRAVVRHVVPQIRDQTWFFDTELLVLSEKQGYRIGEVPVRWVEDTDSRVKIVRTAWDDIKGILRVRLLLWQWALGGGTPARRMAGAPTPDSA